MLRADAVLILVHATFHRWRSLNLGPQADEGVSVSVRLTSSLISISTATQDQGSVGVKLGRSLPQNFSPRLLPTAFLVLHFWGVVSVPV